MNIILAHIHGGGGVLVFLVIIGLIAFALGGRR